MKVPKILLCLALLLLLSVPALAEEDQPQPYTGDMVGTWCFADDFYTPYPDDLVVSSTPTRTPLVLTAVRGDFAPDQTFAVYESPRGEELRRAGNGKAKVSTNGEIIVYGHWMGTLLVEYEISADRHRIGWIEAEMADVPDLDYTDANSLCLCPCGVVTASVALTDDPLYSQESIAVMSGGTSVHVLGQLDDWLLVEGFIGDDVRMGVRPGERSGHAGRLYI